ncbi:MAG: AAA family ATPase [Bryobacterales bacterium]|nr:AAA family ATPase [Bryobacterales bacterium]
MPDFARLRELLVEELIARGNPWTSFSEIAWRLTGDPAMADAFCAIASAEPGSFLVNQERLVVRLRPSQLIANGPQDHEVLQSRLAAEAVRTYAWQLQPVELDIRDIHPGLRVQDRFLHELVLADVDEDIRLTDDTPVRLESANGAMTAGYVAGIRSDGASVFVNFDREMLRIDLPARLRIYRNKVWIDIAERLENLPSTPKLMLNTTPSPGQTQVHNDTYLAAYQLAEIAGRWTRILWGPPGSGKTHCIGYLASYLARCKGERILIVAPSNVAVDVALEKVVRHLNQEAGHALLAGRKILRYGYARSEGIITRPELLGPSELEELNLRIAETHRRIRQLERARADTRIIAAAKTELQVLQQERRNGVAQHANSVRIAATTLASLASPACPLREAGPWDLVVVDEASMVSGAAVMLLASLSQGKFLLAGDPRQLGPVFEWTLRNQPPTQVKHWLAKDPYELAGLSNGTGVERQIETADTRLVRIVKQRRCHPAVWSLVQDLYPVVGEDVDLNELNNITSLPPREGSAVVVLDISTGRMPAIGALTDAADDAVAVEYDGACVRAGRSWKNPPTAWLAIDVAREMRAQDKHCRVAIVSPYRGQVRLIRNWLQKESATDGNHLENIEVGTVHAFQGGEADVVIFDLTDGPPKTGLGFLSGDQGLRLLNVAVTRARGKLIVIAHKEWLENCTRAEQNPLLWRLVTGNNVAVSAVLPPLSQDFVGGMNKTTAGPESPIEEVLFRELQRRQGELPEFVCQHRIYNDAGRIVSRADFAFVTEQLAIYCDGRAYHLNEMQWQRDLNQRRSLALLGWKHLAFTGAEILADNGTTCVNEIVLYFAQRQ